MKRMGNERGVALVATLAIAAILLPVGAWMLMQTRADFLIGHNLRVEVEAFYVAEAGLAHAAAQIEADAAFDRLLAAPASGLSPFSSPPPPFPSDPCRYDVVVTPAGSGRLRVVSTGYGNRGAVKRVEALLWRRPDGGLEMRWLESL
jgi:hypothetical protein